MPVYLHKLAWLFGFELLIIKLSDELPNGGRFNKISKVMEVLSKEN